MTGELQASFGRRAGWLRHHVALGLFRLGAFSPLVDIDFDRVRRLVFVCAGNICRSAYAEGRARALGLRAVSLGLQARDGVAADPAIVRRATARGLDLSAHRARRFAPELVADGDLVAVLEPAHLTRASSTAAPVTLLGLWATPPRPHIEDPYGLSEAYVDTCLSVIDSAVDKLGRLAKGARDAR